MSSFKKIASAAFSLVFLAGVLMTPALATGENTGGGNPGESCS